MAKDYISHPGIIKEIKDNSLVVSIISTSGCASCQLKGACSASETTEKEVEVAKNTHQHYQRHQKVVVAMRKGMGMRAVWWAYILPFLLLLTSLFTLNYYLGNEGLAGLISLAILVPYYVLLHLSNKKLKRQFNFFIIDESTE